jgi:hypothetical protein
MRRFSAITALCLVGVTGLAWAQFETRATNPFPEGAYSIATGDFNHDGKLDVVMITGNGFSVALGKGDGTFQPAVTYTTQLSYSLAVADFNGDGNLDIVVANENQNPSTVSVYLGNGDGTFRAPIDSDTTSYNEFVVVGDFNGDGKPDIVVIENPYISVLLGNGDGTFQPPSDNNSFVGAHWLAVGDFNNDHKLDVVTVGYFGGSDDMGVLLGNGDGTLQPSLTYPLQYVPGAVAVGHLRRGGNLDAIVGDDLGGLAVFAGNGDGSFQPVVYYDTTGLDGGQMVIADLNLDGRLDVAIPSGAGVDVFWGNGDGTFQAAQFFASGEAGLLAVGDLNGDRLPDFTMGTTFFGVITMLNTGVASFSPTAPLIFPTQLFNTKSKSQVVRLTNSGTASLSIASIKVSGPFQISNNCGGSVAPGAKCSITSVFEPKRMGTYAGLITISDSASTKPQFIELSGTATAVKVAPTILKFGNQKVGTMSAPQSVTATNEGSSAITFSSVGVGGANWKDFSETDNCTGQAIQPGASCTATVTFNPIKTGARNAALYFNLPTGSVSPAPPVLTGTGD